MAETTTERGPVTYIVIEDGPGGLKVIGEEPGRSPEDAIRAAILSYSEEHATAGETYTPGEDYIAVAQRSWLTRKVRQQLVLLVGDAEIERGSLTATRA